jgi:hypothetical protein
MRTDWLAAFLTNLCLIKFNGYILTASNETNVTSSFVIVSFLRKNHIKLAEQIHAWLSLLMKWKTWKRSRAIITQQSLPGNFNISFRVSLYMSLLNNACTVFIWVRVNNRYHLRLARRINHTPLSAGRVLCMHPEKNSVGSPQISTTRHNLYLAW